MSRRTKGRALQELALGLPVEKTLATLANGNIFTIYGRVLVTLLWGESVTAGDGGATTLKLQEETNSLDLCAATTITGDVTGTLYFLTGELAVILNGTGNAPGIGVAANLTGMPSSPIIIGMPGATDAIQQVQTGDDATGVITWHLHYIPLEDDAYVVAA
jgi:hypothetical protein